MGDKSVGSSKPIEVDLGPNQKNFDFDSTGNWNGAVKNNTIGGEISLWSEYRVVLWNNVEF